MTKKRCAYARLAMVLLWAAFALTCHAATDPQERSSGLGSGDLVAVLEFMSRTFRVPVIAELNASYPPEVAVPDQQHISDFLNRLVGQFPEYMWENRDGVVLFYHKEIHDEGRNPFNVKIKFFAMPEDLAELRIDLSNAMADPERSAAPVMAGVLEPALQTVKLRKGELLSNVTGRDVLVEAAKETHNLFSIVIFPNPPFRKGEDIATRARLNWTLRSIDELPKNPTRARSIPRKR